MDPYKHRPSSAFSTPFWTTNSGAPVWNNNSSLTIGSRVYSGLTNSNYTELSQLYEKYKNQGFEILAFPCNQFGAQEPINNEQILESACTRFDAEYPIFDVNQVLEILLL
ncbi:hypothetical protein EZV62_006522 [Acer yangbiense]|uniref:Glutathione peroxidase n=1 Tax=Acer yangbiense TaxID=1000413 RepID=A0A5C7I7X6_9ROSI|nr:hypothetical protein EZV62_006522 [Acer yangbiense]